MMGKYNGFLFAAAFSVSVLTASESLESYLPDDTLFAIKIEKLSEIDDEFGDGALGSLFADEKMSKFFAPIVTQFEIDEIRDRIESEDGGVGWERFEELFPGQVVFAGVAPRPDSEGVRSDPKFFLMAEYTGEMDELEKLMSYISDEAHPPKGSKVNAYEEQFLDTTLFLEEVDMGGESVRHNGWALVDGVLVIGDPVEALKNAVVRIASPGTESTLADEPQFLRSRDTAEGSQLSIYVDLKDMIGTFNEVFLSSMKKSPVFAGDPAMMGVTPEGIMNGLRLDMLESIIFAWGSEDGFGKIKSGVFYKEQLGLLKLLAYRDRGEVPRPLFVPEEVLSSSVSLFSFEDAWDAFEELLTAVSPMLGQMYAASMGSAKAQTGLDFRQGVIASLGDVLVTATVPLVDKEDGEDYGMTSQLIAVSLTDAPALRNYIETTVNLMAPGSQLFDERDYLGNNIYTLKNMGASAFSYAITNEHFFFSTGNTDLLEFALRPNQRPAGSLWQSRELEDAYTLLPHGASEYNFTDVEKMIDGLFDTMVMVQRKMKQSGNPWQFCDPMEFPTDVKLPYIMVSGTYVGDNAMRTEAIMIDKEEN